MIGEITIKRGGPNADWGIWCTDGFATFRADQEGAIDMAMEHNHRSHRDEYRIAIEVFPGKKQ